MIKQSFQKKTDNTVRTDRILPATSRYVRDGLVSIRRAIKNDACLKVIILLTVTGLFLRLWHIGEVSLWLDEVLTNYYSGQSLWNIWKIGTQGVNPPTFYWIEHFMLNLGSSEVVLRIIPALVGACTIPVFYFLGREFHNRDTGIVAAALLALSPFHIYYSQEARPYTLLLFFFSIALVLYLRANKTNFTFTWILFGLFSALTCWAHFFGSVMIGTLFAHAFLVRLLRGDDRMADIRPVILAGGICLLLASPMLLATLHAGFSGADQSGSWGYRGISLITVTIQKVSGNYPAEIYLLTFLFLLGILWLIIHDRKTFLLIAVVFVLSLMISFILSYRIAMVPRYLVGLAPFFYLVISYFISSLKIHVFPFRITWLFLILLVIISVPSLNIYYSADSKYGHDWKRFAPQLSTMTGDGDVIMVYPGYQTVPLNYYYRNQTDHTFIYAMKNATEIRSFISQHPGQEPLLIIVGAEDLNANTGIDNLVRIQTEPVGNREEIRVVRVTNQSNQFMN